MDPEHGEEEGLPLEGTLSVEEALHAAKLDVVYPREPDEAPNKKYHMKATNKTFRVHLLFKRHRQHDQAKRRG